METSCFHEDTGVKGRKPKCNHDNSGGGKTILELIITIPMGEESLVIKFSIKQSIIISRNICMQ